MNTSGTCQLQGRGPVTSLAFDGVAAPPDHLVDLELCLSAFAVDLIGGPVCVFEENKSTVINSFNKNIAMYEKQCPLQGR